MALLTIATPPMDTPTTESQGRAPESAKVSLTRLMQDELAQSRKDAEALTAQRAGDAGRQLSAAAEAGAGAAAPKRKKSKPKAMDMARFGLTNEAQWLLTVPSRFEDYKTFTDDFRDLYQGTAAMLRGRIVSKKMYDGSGAETTNPQHGVRLRVVIQNDRGQRQTLTAFGRPGWNWKGYEADSDVIVRGMPKINTFGGRNEMELTGAEVVNRAYLGRIMAIYPAIQGTRGSRFAEKVALHKSLADTAAQLLTLETGWGDRVLGPKISEVTQFDSAAHLIQELHWPSSIDLAHKAQLAARFLSAWTLIRKTHNRLAAIEANPRSIVNIDMGLVDELKSRVPFDLTRDQHEAIDGICRSLRAPLPMTGLLSGDVGTGKTLAFLIPLVATIRAGKTAMLMTPNLLLIKQVCLDMEALFPDVALCRVTGGGIEGNPSGSLVIGTSALTNQIKKGKIATADFAVIDEQHRFSVEQRSLLLAPHSNALEATATPIPRTAALALHGAKDLFLLQQTPVTKSINSRILTRDQAKDARNAVLHAIFTRREQAAVIYPMVEASATEDKPQQNVMEAAANWSRMVPMERIAVLHGRLKDEEKGEILDSFRRGEKDLLLSSTVIEVGVTLPDLKTMLVLGAETFGVVTLHQLRGRLARKGGTGEFMMFTDSEEPDAAERLQLLVDHCDGFTLAEKDAEKRGYGDLLGLDGDTQSGRTRTVFIGVNIGPKHISFAAHMHEKLMAIENASVAADLVAHTAKTLAKSLKP